MPTEISSEGRNTITDSEWLSKDSHNTIGLTVADRKCTCLYYRTEENRTYQY